MLLIAILFCFFDNKNIDILRTNEEEKEVNIPDPTSRSMDDKKEVAYSIMD